MENQTMAQAVPKSEGVDVLWEEVEEVESLDDGSDLYTYPDGSQLKSLGGVITVL